MTGAFDFGAQLSEEDQDLTARELALRKAREEWRMAARAFVDRLIRAGHPLPEFAARLDAVHHDPPPGSSPEERAKPAYDGVTRIVRVGKPRIGAQRATVLLYIAKATQEGREVTAREIAEGSGEDYKRVVNVIWLDKDRGVLDYADKSHPRVGAPKQVKMTEIGFEVLRKAGLLDAPAKESP